MKNKLNGASFSIIRQENAYKIMLERDYEGGSFETTWYISESRANWLAEFLRDEIDNAYNRDMEQQFS